MHNLCRNLIVVLQNGTTEEVTSEEEEEEDMGEVCVYMRLLSYLVEFWHFALQWLPIC